MRWDHLQGLKILFVDELKQASGSSVFSNVDLRSSANLHQCRTRSEKSEESALQHVSHVLNPCVHIYEGSPCKHFLISSQHTRHLDHFETAGFAQLSLISLCQVLSETNHHAFPAPLTEWRAERS